MTLTKDSFLAKFEPMMVSFYKGAACRRCGAWVPCIVSDSNEFASYERHLAWHKEIEPLQPENSTPENGGRWANEGGR